MAWLFKKLFDLGLGCTLRTGRWAVRVLPQGLLLSLPHAVAHLGFYLFPSFRKRSVGNLSLALGEELGPREMSHVIRRSLRNFLRDFVEIGLALEASSEEIRAGIPLRGRENLEAALAKGKGVIALSAHLGNFFLVGTRLAIEGYPVHVLVNQSENGYLPQLLDRYRLEIGQRTVHARPRHQAFHELVQVLRRNELAVVIADEYRSGSGIYAPFFGRTVLARRGPATLALRTAAAVVPVYMIREPSGRLTLMIEPEMELARSGEVQSDLRENTLRLTQWLEWTVRAYPDQWNWMNVHWKESSPGVLLEKKPAAKEVLT